MFRQRILLSIGNYLTFVDSLSPVDVIHVIAGGDYRTDYAIQLYKQGYAKTIFFTGGWCSTHGYYHGIHGQELALSQGVPPDAIAYDDSSVTSTYEETVRLKAWMDQHLVSVQSVMVVSDPFHMRRARWTNRFVLGKAIKIIMAPVPFDQTPYQQQWWTDQASTRYVKDEYKKLAYYYFRYGLSIKWLAFLDKE
jgi:uncharacterized SAM-binding protein YcdF (DUF218 family)